MLEIRYNISTKELTGWCGDEAQFGKLKDRGDEAIVTLDIPIPDKPLNALLYDETILIDNPDYIPPAPPLSTHISTLVSIEVGVKRPAKVKRVWEGNDYFYDCFVTENIKDQYVAGDIKIGDYLLVHFDPIGEQIVTAKIFKSW